MADSPPSSPLSDPLSSVGAEMEVEIEAEEEAISTAAPSSRPSVDMTARETDTLAPPSKRRKTQPSTLATLARAPSSPPPAEEDDNVSISSDGFSTAPASPTHDEYALRDEAQTQCLWKDCTFGEAANNDELVKHVQGTHCATGGPKKSKYVCEWGECQRKTSNHPSGYALKAHMRSHTKEKPYYCALPECDKAFTRSDALAKHMRTVHEPEPAKNTTHSDPSPPGKKPIKLKLTNGSSKPPPQDPADTGPTHDEDGNPVNPSPANDNISYTPAHHPITGQPGFMITYPPDIDFSSWESSLPANQLVRLLRRQLHWAQSEGEEVARECERLEKIRKEEWKLKEILLDGLMEAELERGEKEGLMQGVERRARERMQHDAEPAKKLSWAGGVPAWRRNGDPSRGDGDEEMPDASTAETPPEQAAADRTPSPPPTGRSGGFDGDADPYDNYLAGRLAEYEERERLRSAQNTPLKTRTEQAAAEAEAVGALVGMSTGGP